MTTFFQILTVIGVVVILWVLAGVLLDMIEGK